MQCCCKRETEGPKLKREGQKHESGKRRALRPGVSGHKPSPVFTEVGKGGEMGSRAFRKNAG